MRAEQGLALVQQRGIGGSKHLLGPERCAQPHHRLLDLREPLGPVVLVGEPHGRQVHRALKADLQRCVATGLDQAATHLPGGEAPIGVGGQGGVAYRAGEAQIGPVDKALVEVVQEAVSRAVGIGLAGPGGCGGEQPQAEPDRQGEQQPLRKPPIGCKGCSTGTGDHSKSS